MKTRLAFVILAGSLCAWAQDQPAPPRSVPIYRVTVVERTVKAVNYQYRNGPTPIDFRGTVLLPHAKGNATVESKKGRTDIDARFEHMEAPTRFGPEYLTYVLWAITPDGHPKNLGEVLAGSGDKAHLHVTTDLQAFGMIVTAEPYSAVRQPSDVVVLENEVRPDTVGHIEPVEAKYELMPRGHYTYNVPANMAEAALSGPEVSMDDYEKLVEVYQAQNAVQIAQAMGADRLAPDTFAKARQQLENARQLQRSKADRSAVVTAARQAAETAEDARTIAEKRKQQEDVAQAKAEASREQSLRLQAEAEARQARAQAQVSAERAVPETQPATVQTVAPPPSPASVTAPADRSETRAALLRDLSPAMPARDTPRGIVVTLNDGDFRGSALDPAAYERLSRMAAVLAAHPGLRVVVEGNTDNFGSEAREEELSYARAIAVRDALTRNGVGANAIYAKGLGSSRPVASNATAAGRIQNRRVEITIAGDPIGISPNWGASYPAEPGQ